MLEQGSEELLSHPASGPQVTPERERALVVIGYDGSQTADRAIRESAVELDRSLFERPER